MRLVWVVCDECGLLMRIDVEDGTNFIHKAAEEGLAKRPLEDDVWDVGIGTCSKCLAKRPRN